MWLRASNEPDSLGKVVCMVAVTINSWCKWRMIPPDRKRQAGCNSEDKKSPPTRESCSDQDESQALGIQRTGDDMVGGAANAEMKTEVGVNEWMDDSSQRLERERELVSPRVLGGRVWISPYHHRRYRTTFFPKASASWLVSHWSQAKTLKSLDQG